MKFKLEKRELSKLSIIFCLILALGLTGCAMIKDKIARTKGELLGNHFNISVYDHYGSKTLTMDGRKVTISNLKEDLEEGLEESDSSVLEITINGKQLIQVGNTLLFAEDGLNQVEDFEMPEAIEASSGGGFVPVDRYINDFKNKIGENKTIIISSPKGIPIGVYEGKKVFVTVPKDLPKMTRLNIDGKSLYIHRANYLILDTDLMN